MAGEEQESATWARRQAHRVLCRWSGQERRIQLRPLITAVADRASGHQREKNLFWQLVLGVVRHCRLLDAVLKACLRRGLPGPGEVRQALRLGLFQLLFLSRVPARAAVDQSVRLVGVKSARALVNAVLRKVADAVREEQGPVVDPTRQLALPEGRRLELEEAFLPDPGERLAAWLGIFHSHPDLLVRRWLRRWGRETAERILAAGNANPPLSLRLNPLRGGLEEVAALLRAAGVEEIRPGPRPGTLQIDWVGNPAGLEPLQRGLVTVQDPSAMRAGQVLDPKPGERILDLCAAPGGKTTQIAEAMGDRGEVFAWDLDPSRLARVRQAVARLGLSSVRVLEGETLAGVVARGPYDRILVDAPCTATGVLAKRPEARWKLRFRDWRELPERQGRILAAALEALRPGGALVYSTCSLEPEENELVVGAAAGARVVHQETLLPEGGICDGAFVARLEME